MKNICQIFADDLRHLDRVEDLKELVLCMLEIHSLAAGGDQPERIGTLIKGCEIIKSARDKLWINLGVN